jgi:hypothetical protein
MKKLLAFGVLTATLSAGWAFQQSPPANQSDVSLADYARKLREQQKSTLPSKPAKVYTNDDVQQIQRPGGVTVANAPAASTEAETPGGAAHDAKYYQKAYGKLLAQKQLHERELEVLQQKLAIGNIQYYPDPNKQLQQTSGPLARSDINKTQADVDAKKKEIESDDNAISDLEDQLRHDGGDPGWLRGVAPSFESETATSGTQSGEDKNPKDKKRTKEYWQARFRAVRADVKKAEEMQKLLEDETSLLQRRKLQEMSADAQNQIGQDLSARQSELDAATAATGKAKKELDDLQKEFDDSGAPAEWSVAENAPSGP